MSEKTDYIDITPKGVEPEATGQAGKNTTIFQDTEWNQINNNPGRLTKEGVEEKIRIWKKCINRHVVLKYITMKNRCQKFAPSGVTEQGHIIFARDKAGNAHWTSENTKAPVPKEVPKEPKEQDVKKK